MNNKELEARAECYIANKLIEQGCNHYKALDYAREAIAAYKRVMAEGENDKTRYVLLSIPEFDQLVSTKANHSALVRELVEGIEARLENIRDHYRDYPADEDVCTGCSARGSIYFTHDSDCAWNDLKNILTEAKAKAQGF